MHSFFYLVRLYYTLCVLNWALHLTIEGLVVLVLRTLLAHYGPVLLQVMVVFVWDL